MPDETEHGNNRHMRVHIDRVAHESPDPTTGEALYRLGQLREDQQLYREVQGDEEDEPIEYGEERVHLARDEHFYSEEKRHEGFTIIVNTRPERVKSKCISFDQLVAIAYPTPPEGDNLHFTITYYKGPKENPEGTLVAGQSVKVKNGMVFNVKATNRS